MRKQTCTVISALLLLAFSAHNRVQAAMDCPGEADSCQTNNSAAGASLLQRNTRLNGAARLRTETQDGRTLAEGDFIVRRLTELPDGWQGCNRFNCDKWREFVACGVSESELYTKMVEMNVNMVRVVIGDKASRKIARKNEMPYSSVNPVACDGDSVHFLVNRDGNIGRSATAAVVRTLNSIGISEPFTCDAEYWLRVRMSESMEAEPSPFLLGSLPEFMTFEGASSSLTDLLQEARRVESQLEEAQEARLQAEAEKTGGGGAALLQGMRSAEASLSAALAKLEQQIDRNIKDLMYQFLRLRQRFGHSHGIALGARFIRMIFHDAADYKNLQDSRGNRVCGPSHPCGGVDFRLHTALLSVGLGQHSMPVDDQTDPDDVFSDDDEDEKEALGDPNHNRGLTNAFRWVNAWRAHTTILSRADLVVLGAHVAMETWFSGPEMTYEAGRIDATNNKSSGSLVQQLHEAEYCTDEHCLSNKSLFLASPVAEPVGDGMFCPFGNTLTELAVLLGLSEKELIALQGSHSIGGIIRCSGMGNTATGPFCGGVQCCPPGMEDKDGTCECTRSDCRGLAAGMNGATFDGTPNKLDNLYYKQLDRANFTELPDCEEIAGEMPSLSSGDQKIFICMKKKGFRWKGDSVGENGSSWEQAVAAGCADRIKGAYSGRSREETCKATWGEDGNGIKYSPRSWCAVDDCMQRCEESSDCGSDKPLAEIGVLMGRFQNMNYGKKCHHVVLTFDPAVVQSVLDAIPQNEYMDTTITSNLTLMNNEGDDFEAKDLRVTHCGGSKGREGRNRTARRKCKMKSYLQEIFDSIPIDANGMLTGPVRMDFAEPGDPYCNQCTVPQCEADATAALEDAIGAAKPATMTNVEWLEDFMRPCKACKQKCLDDDANSNGDAANRKPEWCLKKTSTGFCARGGKSHECPREHKYGIPNHGDGRKSMILNTMRWTRFRGQTRRIMLLPSDWSYLGNETHRGYIHEFAEDNAHFQEHWKLAFQKVSKLGMQHGTAKTCSAAHCSVADDGASIVCPEANNPGLGVEELTFDRCSGDRDGITATPILPAGSACRLTRNFGVRAVFDCGGESGLLYCTTTRAHENERQAKRELAFGTDLDKCWQDFGISSTGESTGPHAMRGDDS